MYDDYANEMDEQSFWQQVENEEQAQQDWQALLDDDPEYHKWADDLDRLAKEDREIMALADIENERKFNTLQPWD